MKKAQINIVTLGCSKNLVDSEKLMAQLSAGGLTVVHEGSLNSAPVVIVNTCGFIKDAKEESIDTILQFVKAKEQGKIEKLIITGCLSERYREELKMEIPEADGCFGVNETGAIVEALSLKKGEYRANERIITGLSHYAYLKVSEGCSRSCSFCAIPMIRGGHISRSMEDIADEAALLHSKGVKELILVAQDLTYYGLDLYGERKISQLVQNISELKAFNWIRLHYLFPAGFPVNLLEIIRSESSVCQYIDIPIQHISDKMLKIMNRIAGEKETRELLWKIREELPGAAIRTTLITGHPGESSDDFKRLKEFVSEYRFDRLGVFAYSHEEKTISWKKQKDDVPPEVKEERVAEIMELQQNISEENNRKMIGLSTTVIIDKREGAFLVGRTMHDSPEIDQEILIKTESEVKPGTFCEVTITESQEFDLYGEIIQEEKSKES